MASPYNTRSTRATTQRRHFCIALTNNPRMIQSAARHSLQTVALDIQAEQDSQQQQQPEVLMQSLQVPAPIRTRRRPVEVQHVEQQVPMVAPMETTTNISAPNMGAYEKEIEEDFQTQIQPILQLYLQKTRRPHPINIVLDMSNHIQV